MPATATQVPAASPAAAAGMQTAPPASGGGNADNGKAMFTNGFGDPAVLACSTCHNVDSPDVKVGPSLMGLMGHAGMHAQEQGQDIPTYLHTSIVNPNAFLVPNDGAHVFSAGGTSLMYQDYAKHLSDQQINDLVAYLQTLK